MKLKNVQAYHIKDVPDYLVEECKDLAIALTVEVKNLFENKDANIILGAITFFHAAMIKSYISDKPDQQKNAARLTAIGLIKNVHFLNGIDLDTEYYTEQ